MLESLMPGHAFVVRHFSYMQRTVFQVHNEIKLFRLIGGMALDMASTIPADQFNQLPAGGGNSPNWIMGHLVICNAFGLSILGHDNELLPAGLAIYGPGSVPTEDAAMLTNQADLLSQFQETSNLFADAVEKADPALFDKPQGSPFLQEQLPTNGDMLRHLLTTHLAMHSGQMSAWRRSRGFPSILKI